MDKNHDPKDCGTKNTDPPNPIATLHMVRFPDGSMYQAGFPTAREAEPFRSQQFGHRSEGPVGEVVEVVCILASTYRRFLEQR